MVDQRVREALLVTTSCLRGPRDQLGSVHCGACGGCVYRRVALHSVGLRDESYVWSDLSGSDLSECSSDGALREVTKNDEDIARHAIHSLESIARLGALEPDDGTFRATAWELASRDTDRFRANIRSLRDLCRTHAREWASFWSQFAGHSLLRCYERNTSPDKAK